MKSERYVVFRVEVEHEPGSDPEEVCAACECTADTTTGAITKSEVVKVLKQEELVIIN